MTSSVRQHSCLLLGTLLSLALLPIAAKAQERFLDLESQTGSLLPLEEHGISVEGAEIAEPGLELRRSDEILASYEASVRSLEDLARFEASASWMQDSETGSVIQSSNVRTTALGTAGGFFSATLGVKGMQDKSEWDPLETQGAGSLEFAWRLPRSSFAGVVGLAGSYAQHSRNDNTFTGTIDTWDLEFYLGGKGYFEIPKSAIWGYAGLGVSMIYTEVEGGIQSAPNLVNTSSDFGLGMYAQLGILLRLNRAQSIGFEYRGLFFTNTDFFGVDNSVDYNQFSFVFLVAF